MSLVGSQYPEIDEIYELIEQHLDKHGQENLDDCISRIFTAIKYGLRDHIQIKQPNN